ncbi:MAG TPA: TssQ family T6SS-associated lipoprotein [Burkholderiales bacterium]|nr:TssQ family T6SS-associated lipoprotein [Burkholderiales bacterium]
MRRTAPPRHALLAAAAAGFWLAACAPLAEKPEAQAPRITEADLRNRAHEQLAEGMREYQQGEFDAARRDLSGSLDHGLLTKSEQSTARKHLAFIYCMQGHEADCRDEFRKAIEIDPGFDLSPAESGHPIWGPVYAGVNAKLRPPPEPAKAPRNPAQQLLDEGLAKYNGGDYAGAAATLEKAVKTGLADKGEQVMALKHAAFSYCLLSKFSQCRSAFNRIYEIDPTFALTAAESGHPSWHRTYESARRRAQAGGKK